MTIKDVERQGISDEVWEQNYKSPKDQSLDDTWTRQAKACSSVEEKSIRQQVYEDFKWLLTDFKGIAGGRITANLGVEGREATTLMNCFLPGTKVLTVNGYVSIENICVGDKVLTHTGNWQSVHNTLSRYYEGEVDSYKSSLLNNTVVCTTNHEFYQGNNEWTKSHNNKILALPFVEDCGEYFTIDIQSYLDENIIHNKLGTYLVQIKNDDDKVWHEKDFIGGNGARGTKSSVPINKKFRLDEDAAYLFGRFIGDGSVYSTQGNEVINGVNIVFSDLEKDHMKKCNSIIENTFGISFNENMGDSFHYLRKANIVLASFFASVCGIGVDKKRVPSFIMESKESVRKSFLLGLLDSDGMVGKNGVIKLTLSNESLIDDVKFLFNSIGLIPRKNAAYVSHVENAKPAWVLQVSASQSQSIFSDLLKVYADDRLSQSFGSKNKFHKYGKNFISSDFEKSTYSYKGMVYNISVNKDESYVVEGVVVHNCFVHNPSDIGYADSDSIHGIYKMLECQAQTLKSEGGYGMNFSWIRPNGSYVAGIDSRTPGVLNFMELWDTSSKIITMGSEKVLGEKRPNEKKKIRKGAQMGILDCWHPEIEDFIEAKLVEGRLSKFNISVGITEGFMEAVLNDTDWDLKFPDTECKEYKKQWFGNIYDWEAKGLPVIVHKTIRAKDLWTKITKSTYTRNDPGVLFFDHINKMNPLYYAERIATTNPCFAGSERFLTETGYIRFDESSQPANILVDGRISYHDDGPEKPDNWKISNEYCGTVVREASSAFITKEYSDLLLLEFSNGQTLKCTPDHHIATSDGMVEAQYLTPEHEILVPRTTPPVSSIFGSIPKSKNEKASFLMGLITGDGCIHKNTAHIDLWGDDRDRMKNICCEIIDSLHDDSPDLVEKPKNWKNRQLSKYYISESDNKIRISSTWLKYFLEQIYAFDKRDVPEFVIQNARTSSGQFYLAGFYYADGTVSKNKQKGISVRLAQSNKEILRSVQLICHANGILTSIYKRRDAGFSTFKTGTYEHKKQYELITTHGSWKEFCSIGFAGHPNKDSVLLSLKNEVIKNYQKNSYTNLVSIEQIEGDTVYCLKEHVSRALTVNGIAARRCGEISMSTGVCLLFSLNLVKFIKKSGGNFVFDYDEFKKAVKIATRFADNINDISRVPLDAYKNSMQEKRRLGIGVLSLGSLHYCLGIRFGSEESQQLIRDIFKAKAETEILTSAELGAEKGSFKLFDKEKYFNSHWWKTLPISKFVKKKVEEIGEMRNSHRAANAPTGNMSIYSGVMSGGIEPVFMKEYARWAIVPERERMNLKEEGFEFPNIFSGEWFETKHLKASKAGADDCLLGKFNGIDYQVDKNRGLTKRTVVQDWGWMFVQANYSEEEIAQMEARGVFVTTEDLSVEEHLKTLEIIAPFVDQNSSKTINVPNDYSYEKFESVYLDAWKAGIKGITTYRAGTMTAVLEAVDKSTESVGKASAPKRPKELPCELHRTKIKGKEWAVVVGLYNGKPYEVFAGPISGIEFPQKGFGQLVKKKKGQYSLIMPDMTIDNIVDYINDEDSAWATRMISMSMRHGIPLEFIYDQLSKDGTVVDVNNILARILKKYINLSGKLKCPQCGSESVVLEQACMKCLQCNFGKCG